MIAVNVSQLLRAPVGTSRSYDIRDDALLGVATEVSASMIVVGSKGMHGAKRLVLGSVPNKVSHNACCNVLIVSTDQD